MALCFILISKYLNKIGKFLKSHKDSQFSSAQANLLRMFRRLPASALGVLRGGAAHFRTKRTIVNTVKAFTTKPPFHTTIVGAAAAAALGFSGAFLSLSTSPASVVAEGTQVTPILAEIAAKVKGIEDALNKKVSSIGISFATLPYLSIPWC